jgi:hypothetical protein
MATPCFTPKSLKNNLKLDSSQFLDQQQKEEKRFWQICFSAIPNNPLPYQIIQRITLPNNRLRLFSLASTIHI